MQGSAKSNRNGSIVKALTIRQPWAWCITHGPKRVENRKWRTTHRGVLVLHAGQSREAMVRETWRRLRRAGVDRPAKTDLAFGAIVGVCQIVDCVRPDSVSDDAWAIGPWCLQLAHVQPLAQPIPFAGKRGVFDIDVTAAGMRPLRRLLRSMGHTTRKPVQSSTYRVQSSDMPGRSAVGPSPAAVGA